MRPTANKDRGRVDSRELVHLHTATPAADSSRGHRTTVAIVRRALAPGAVAGPLLCAALLIIVEVVGGPDLPVLAWAGQGLAVLVALAVNLLTSRRAGLRLVHTQQQLHQAVTDLSARQSEMARRNHDLDAIAKATLAVLTGTRARAAVCQAAVDITDGLAAALFEPDASGTTLVARNVSGLDLPDLAVPIDSTSLTARTYATARTQVVPDLVTNPGTDPALLALVRAVPGGRQQRAAVFVPVVHDGRTRAVLVVTLTEPLVDDQRRVLALLELLAADAALALSREDLLDELARQAVTDPLTGLGNRRRWDTELAREASRAARTGAPLSVVLLDLDHFKAYNDSRGHPAGDRLLREAARAWQRLLRTDDVLARIGGEEFAVLLPDCPVENAARLAAGLLRAVPDGQTCSAGVTQYAGDLPEALLARADAALYRAKTSGRNRVEQTTAPAGTTARRALRALP